MTPRTAKKQFLKRLDLTGHTVKTLTPAAGVAAMCQFYADDRAAGCESDDGDMLLFQWGAFDWGKGLTLEINITRQFIANGGAPTQLVLTFRFPAPKSSGIHAGGKWCSSPDDLTAFQRFVSRSKLMKTLKQHLPMTVELRYGAT